MSDELLTIEVDGKPMQAGKGQMIIQVADEAGINIPRFCYHQKLSIAANCRMCLVEVEKMGKPVPACATPVMDGMKVKTKSPMALDAQRGVMEFLLINHPLDCPICDQGGECELQDLAMGYGSSVTRYTEKKRIVADEDIGPLVSTDMTRCIHCTRCVRFGEEIAGLRELGATGRGEDMRIGTYIKNSMVSELSGNVIDICPVGALNNKPYRFSARAWEMLQHPVIGAHDCVGSNLYLHTLRGQVKRAVPHENDLINEAWLSDRDRYSCHAIDSDERITVPQIKRDGKWEDASWDEAFQFLREGMQEVLEAEGADAVGVLSSANSTLEESYLLQKLARGLGTNNIDHRVQQYDFSGDQQEPPMPWLGMDIAELEQLDSVLLCGSNIRKEQPLLAHRLRKAALQGAAVMFVNQRHYDFNFPVSMQHVEPPEHTLVYLVSILQMLARRQSATLPAAVAGLMSLAQLDERHESIVEQLLQGEKTAVLLGSQLMLHPQYFLLKTVAFHIAQLSGATFACLSMGANAAGAWLTGVLPHRGVAAEPLAKPGLDAYQMMRQARRAYILFNVEPQYESWDASVFADAMQSAKFKVVINAFSSVAVREYADVILPLAVFAETAGTFVNVEGRWQSFTAATQPPGDVKPGWKILRMLGGQFELEGFDYLSVEDVRGEVKNSCAQFELSNVLAPGYLAEPSISVIDTKMLRRISDVPIYATDALVRRSPPLQETDDAEQASSVAINLLTAQDLGLVDAKSIYIKQNEMSVRFPLRIDDGVPEGCVWIGLGIKGSDKLGPAYGAVEVGQG